MQDRVCAECGRKATTRINGRFVCEDCEKYTEKCTYRFSLTKEEKSRKFREGREKF